MADEPDRRRDRHRRIQAELDRLKHGVGIKTTAVEQINAASAAVLASVEADIESIETIEGLLAGGEPGEPLPPGGPDLTRGCLFHSDKSITQPVDLAPGQLTGLKAVAMVVKVNVTTGASRASAEARRRLPGVRDRAEQARGARCLEGRWCVQPDCRPASLVASQSFHAGMGR